jgi:hypothetical protein
MPSVLTKIRNRAIAIRKKNPGKKYQTALKEAGREYRQGKIGKGKKIGKAKKVGKAKGRYVPVKAEHCRKIGAVPGQTLSQSLSSVKKQLKAELGWQLLNRDQAKTNTAKRMYNDKIADVRRKLNALS